MEHRTLEDPDQTAEAAARAVSLMEAVQAGAAAAIALQLDQGHSVVAPFKDLR
jgi:hypothetical protein